MRTHVWRSIFLIMAAALFVASISFANMEAFRAAGPVTSSSNQVPTFSIAPNALAGLASLGFAIAGGLALIAAALVRENQ